MGTLTLPSGGSVYLDTSAVIYSVERVEPYLTPLAPAWRQAEAGQFILMCSELTIAEALVHPIRDGDLALETAFLNVFAAPEAQALPTTRQLWEDTARLRAVTGMKTPDALHAVTALRAECAQLVHQSARNRGVRVLPERLCPHVARAGDAESAGNQITAKSEQNRTHLNIMSTAPAKPGGVA